MPEFELPEIMFIVAMMREFLTWLWELYQMQQERRERQADQAQEIAHHVELLQLHAHYLSLVKEEKLSELEELFKSEIRRQVIRLQSHGCEIDDEFEDEQE